MTNDRRKILRRGVISKYRIKLVLMIAFLWTVIDTGVYLFKFYRDRINLAEHPFDMHSSVVLLLRSAIIFFICLVIFLFIFSIFY